MELKYSKYRVYYSDGETQEVEALNMFMLFNMLYKEVNEAGRDRDIVKAEKIASESNKDLNSGESVNSAKGNETNGSFNIYRVLDPEALGYKVNIFVAKNYFSLINVTEEYVLSRLNDDIPSVRAYWKEAEVSIVGTTDTKDINPEEWKDKPAIKEGWLIP